MSQSFVSYYRVSTQRQGLGIDAQRSAAQRYASQVGGQIIAEYSEKESGKNDHRPQLAAAIKAAKENHAVLLVAKLDRLSRHVAFLFQLRDELQAAGVEIVCADMPELVSSTLTLSIFAGMAEHERNLISSRTRAALQALKEKGVQLGRPKGCDTSKAREASAAVRSAQAQAWNEKLCKTTVALYRAGTSLSGIAKIFNSEGRTTPRGADFTATAVRRILVRCGEIEG